MDPIGDIVERKHARAPETPSGKIESKLDRFADRFSAWLLRVGDKLFGPRVSEKLFGPHPRGT